MNSPFEDYETTRVPECMLSLGPILESPEVSVFLISYRLGNLAKRPGQWKLSLEASCSDSKTCLWFA